MTGLNDSGVFPENERSVLLGFTKQFLFAHLSFITGILWNLGMDEPNYYFTDLLSMMGICYSIVWFKTKNKEFRYARISYVFLVILVSVYLLLLYS